MRKISFLTESYYHIYNRGVEKRVIFQNDKDYQRFLLGLKEFNTSQQTHLATCTQYNKTEPQNRLVDILCFCLMPNHYHLIVKQVTENGITQFLHKLGTGYTMYFNKRWERSGVLFEGSFKAKMIETDEYLLHLSRYIHLNPVSLINPHWHNAGITNASIIKGFLEKYKWSSYPVYIKKLNSDIISLESAGIILNNVSNYEKFVCSWTHRDVETIKSFLLEDLTSYEAKPR